MLITPCYISFSISELQGINGQYIGYHLNRMGTLQAEYDGLIHVLDRTIGQAPIVVASVTTKQEEAAEFLLANGFRQVGKKRVNPNSANSIMLFVKKQEAKPSPETFIAQQHTNWVLNRGELNKRLVIYYTNISCGIRFLNIPNTDITKADLDKAFTSHLRCSIVLTTVASSRCDTIKLLEDNGFFKVEEAVGYYKDCEPFALYMRQVSLEDRKQFSSQTALDLEGKTKEDDQ